MLGHELAVEQPESADEQPRHQPGQRHLGRIGAQREHTLTEKGAAQPNAVKTADQFLVLPTFYRVGVAEAMEEVGALLDLAVDPSLLPRSAGRREGTAGVRKCKSRG